MCKAIKPKRRVSVVQGNWWDKRDLTQNKPSISQRTAKVLEYVMEEDESLHLGTAIEKLIKDSPTYKAAIEELKKDFEDIVE